MKKLAFILIPVFLVLSTVTTIYIVKTNKRPAEKIAFQSSPSPTETVNANPTDLPLSETLSPTPVLTKTAVNPSNDPPSCIKLSASPNSGTAPLTVHFVVSAMDLDGSVSKFIFDYGDGKNQTIEKNIGKSGSIEIEHTYTTVGSFAASVIIEDNKKAVSQALDECTQIIKVAGDNPVSTTAPLKVEISTEIPRGGPGEVAGTATPTATLRATNTPTPRTATSSAVAPDVPVSGDLLPTLMLGLGGIMVLILGLALAF